MSLKNNEIQMGLDDDDELNEAISDEDEEGNEENEENEDNDELSKDDKNDAPTIDKVELSKKETYYYKIIDKFYKSLNPLKVTLMIDIIEGRSDISLRLLDWFVTRYANKYKVRYVKLDDTSGLTKKKIDKSDKIDNSDKMDKFEQSIDEGFNVHISYKAQLKSYKKRYFDPFRRRKKFKYFFDKQKNIFLCTTIGQLNFFKWAFNNHVIEYVSSKYKPITKAMGTSNKLDKTRKQKALKTSIKSMDGSITDKATDESEIKSEEIKSEEIKLVKDGIKIKAQKKETQNEIKIVLSFD